MKTTHHDGEGRYKDHKGVDTVQKQNQAAAEKRSSGCVL